MASMPCCTEFGRYRGTPRLLLRLGVKDAGLLEAVSRADLAAFGAQSPRLAKRYRAS